jgi:hypothetical protein
MNNSFYVLGGVQYEHGVILANVYACEQYASSSRSVLKLDPETSTWSDLIPATFTYGIGLRGTQPDARQAMTAVVLRTSDGQEVACMFGGVNTFSMSFFADMWGLHANGGLWTKVEGWKGQKGAVSLCYCLVRCSVVG